ncbi:MAG: hypothetical protein ACFB4J_19475 [Elainellaceae cyanobacterium]
MTNQTSNATPKTTVMSRLVQAAILTLLLQLIAQFYPSALTRTTSYQLQEVNDVMLAWNTLTSERGSEGSAR